MRKLVLIYLVSTMTLWGCEADDEATSADVDSEEFCISGETLRCTCPQTILPGVAVCDAETETWTECDCPALDTGPSIEKHESHLAVGKFCNPLQAVGGGSIRLYLKVGYGNAQVTFFSDTGTCKPFDGESCVAIPVGENVRIVMEDEDGEELANFVGDINAGEEWVFIADVSSGYVSIDGGSLYGSMSCSEVTIDNV